MSESRDIVRVVPIVAWSGTVGPDWIDANRHMTSMAYVALFHPNVAPLFHYIGINESYVTERKLSIFQREFRLSYERELMLGDPIEIRTWLIGHDAKRMHHFHELWHTGENYRAAFVEYMSLHIDMSTRRTGPFAPDVLAKLDELAEAFARVPRPEGSGKALGIPQKRT